MADVETHRVCNKCLVRDNRSPWALMASKCFDPSDHRNAQMVEVRFNPRSRKLEPVQTLPSRIRPVPDVPFKRFILCDRRRSCKGENCSFPHSKEEMDAWNAQRSRSRPQMQCRPVHPVPQPHARMHAMPPFVHMYPPPFHGPLAVLHPIPRSPGFGGHPWPNLHAVDEFPPLPAAPFAPWPARRPPPRASITPTAAQNTQHSYSAKNIQFMERIRDILDIADIQQPLTRENYKEKFHKLLCWEEKAHVDILEERCNGHYGLVLYQAGFKPPWTQVQPHQKRFGYLQGLDGDKIAYATQASEAAFIVQGPDVEISADILPENFRHTDQNLYIAFNVQNDGMLRVKLHVTNEVCERQVEVQFELKHSYFNNLHRAVEGLSPDVIARLIPGPSDFKPDVTIQRIPFPKYPNLKLDEDCPGDQLNALRTAAFNHSDAPPVLISGPFGTGKTRLLAAATYFFLQEGKRNRQDCRVLVCAHHQASADTFLECYFGLMVTDEEHPWRVNLTRLTSEFYHLKSHYRYSQWYQTVPRLRKRLWKYQQSNQLLIITTCLTSLRLRDLFPPGFFTHILLDEGAQAREPEAVAPLCMATKDTKIVIAGDSSQVGPTLLVLGEEARDNGLKESLLERLQHLYTKSPHVSSFNCADLVTNYRCHKEIVAFSSSLFYEASLVSHVPDSVAHPSAPYPLVFVCSSVDECTQFIGDDTNEIEAKAVIEQVARFVRSWPTDIPEWGQRDLNKICIVTSTRSQITIMRRLAQRHNLNRVRMLPTYDIQGQEFLAVFLSTSEPTWEDGSTRNPTKSICDPYIFNTVITRAKALVVSVGNPFMLLKTEKHMVEKYGRRGKCWTEYIKHCLQHKALDLSIEKNVPRQQTLKNKLKELVNNPSTNVHRGQSGRHLAGNSLQLQSPTVPLITPVTGQRESTVQKSSSIKPVPPPATGGSRNPPAPTPATGGSRNPPAPTPATGGSRNPPAPTPATGGSRNPPAPTPTTGRLRNPPAPTPATGGTRNPPAPTPATGRTRNPPAPTPATGGSRNPPAPPPAATGGSRNPPAPTPSTVGSRNPPAPTPTATGGTRNPPAPTPATSGSRNPPAPTPATVGSRNPPAPTPTTGRSRNPPVLRPTPTGNPGVVRSLRMATTPSQNDFQSAPVGTDSGSVPSSPRPKAKPASPSTNRMTRQAPIPLPNRFSSEDFPSLSDAARLPRKIPQATLQEQHGDFMMQQHQRVPRHTDFYKQHYDKLDKAIIKKELTRSNYKEKFHHLLCWEEKEHERILADRCDGKYTIDVFQHGFRPERLEDEPEDEHVRYGLISGSDGDAIAYARQASEGALVFLPNGYKIHVRQVFAFAPRHKDPTTCISIALNKFAMEILINRLKFAKKNFEFSAYVQFDLKHSYFQRLHKAIDMLSPEMIVKVMPERNDFREGNRFVAGKPEYEWLKLDTTGQMQALDAITSSRSTAPVLVVGPFGTGKTRVLARAAYQILRTRDSRVRVLICAHHQASVDTFMECFGEMKQDLNEPWQVKLVRIIPNKSYHSKTRENFEVFYKTASEIKDRMNSFRLFVTTLGTALHLIPKLANSFTHILMDEGAQTREPESIGPLCLANRDTKIIIAGDHYQVGPRLLVLGDEAQENGLGLSLLERLHKRYETLGRVAQQHTVALLTNYRCHSGILLLPSSLFYGSTLQCRVPEDSAHPDAPYPLVFVCSSLDASVQSVNKDTDESEARVLLQQVSRFVTNWPRNWGRQDLSKICIMTPSTNQKALIVRKARSRRDLKGIEVLKAYEIQGREFRAIFIGTSEITSDKGETLNPTKSICDRYVFNTAITRAQSLVVSVGNPLMLLKMERHMEVKYGERGRCWSEYIRRCLECKTFFPPPLGNDELSIPEFQHAKELLYREIYGSIDRPVPDLDYHQDDQHGDSILTAYQKQFESIPDCKRTKLILRNIGRNLIWNLKESEGDPRETEGDQQAEENQLEEENYSETYECQLSIKHFRRAEAIPLDHTKTIVKIGGTGNRRGAFDGDIVRVGIFRNNPVGKCYGKVVEVLEATHDRRFVCTVYHRNSTMFCPIDKKNPLILNLPRLSRDLLMRPWQNKTTINENLKSTDVVIFDPKSVTQCKNGHLPQIQSVIPLSIAQKMLFIVHFLQWKPKYRFPLGIVTGALPKGLSFFEGERLLKMVHDVEYNEQDDHVVSVPSDHQREPSLPLYERAFTIDPAIAKNLDDAVSLVQLESKDKTVRYQLAVHIVNVARHIADGSIQDRKARDLGTSVYAGAEGKTMHMLPVHVRKQLSLDPMCIRDVISIVTNVSLDNDLHNITLHEVTIQQAQVKSSMRLSYKSAQMIMEGQCRLEGLDAVIKGFDASPGQPTLTKTLQLLYRIALHMRQERFKSLAAYCYEVEEPDERSCWQTHMMIEELMIWANSEVASQTYNRFQDMALVRRQGAPNSEEQAAVVGEHSLVMGYSLSLQQVLSQVLTSVPFLIPLCTMTEIIRALDSGSVTLLVNLIASNHYYPQLAASAAQLRSLQQPAEYCCTSSDRDRSFYKHYSLNLDLYTHFTSPMRRYLDIQVQRMVIAILEHSNGQEDFKEDSHQKLCQLLNAKATNAKRFGRKMKSLTLAQRYTSSSEVFDAFITSVSKGSIELCFPNLEMKCVNKQGRTFSIKYLGSLGKVVSDQEDNETRHTWKIKMTSFQHPAFIFDTPGLSQVKRTQEKSSGAESSSDSSSISLKFEVALPDDGSNNRLRMVEYSATTTPPFVKVNPKEWQKALEFVQNPTTEGVQALKDIFHLPSKSLAACSHDPEQNSSSFVVYHLSRSLAAYDSIKVWMTYSTREAILSPRLQLVELAPHMRICLQHNTHPAECFSDPILKNASRKVYNNIQEYVQLWEKVLLAEGSEKSAREGQPVIIQDVTLKWPKLDIPPNCMDEIYYEPQGNVIMELPETFQEESSEFFRIRVGDMICARYGTKTESEVRAVFHMVVAVGPPSWKKPDVVIPSVEMKFIGKENCRVSEKVKVMLQSGGATCEVQLVAMSTSYQRIYKSLVKLAPKSRGRGEGKRDDGVSKLAREIAVGETRSEMRRPYFLSAVEHGKEAHHIFHWDFLARTLWHSGKQLNPVQTEAVELALNKRFQLIQGPPGTGKSETGAHISYVFAMLNRTLEGGKCVLYCGPSNKAVDVVLNNLHILKQKHPQCNLKILRIYGRAVEKRLYPGPYRHKYVYQREQSDYGCPEWAKGYTLHHQIHQVEMHPAFKKVVELEQKFQHDVSQGYIATSSSCKEYRTAITEAEEVVLTKHFDIVLCTCNEASSNRVCGKVGPFGIVKKYVSPRQCIIDESGMASEPESMAPISLCEHVVLLGDHKQLQPIVDYHPAREHGLATSLFQRYAQRDEGFCTTLRIQYRMHEEICAFPSNHFYSGVLETDDSVKMRTNPETRLRGFWPQGPQRPILFCDTVGKEGEYKTGSKGEKRIGIDSKFNFEEAQKVVQLARVLHHVHGVKLNELAILTPYSAQKETIKKLAAEAKLLNESPSDTIKVASITESQGDEYGIVLLSTVRSQPIAEIAHPDRVQADRGWLLENLGFLTDEHQINVGITRSKYGLVIVGNKRLLQYDSTWENLLDHYEKRNCIVNAQSFPRNSDLRKLPRL